MKKSLLVLTSLIGATSLFALASCNEQKPAAKKEVISFTDMYSTSGITGVNLLNQAPQRKMRALTKDEQDKVIENYKVIEGLISDDVIVSDLQASDKAEYETMYEITITNLDGTKETYTYYYNEVTENEYLEEENKKAAMPVDEAEEEDEAEDENEEAETETEVESHLKGIVIMDGKTYDMKGAKEIEKDGNEEEISQEFVITDPETNEMVKIETESETETEDGQTENEEEFAISKYDANNNLVYSKELEVENEAGEVEFELVEEANGKRTGYKYEIMTAEDGSKYVEAEIIEGNNVIRAEFKAVTDAEGNVSYEFLTDDSEDSTDTLEEETK